MQGVRKNTLNGKSETRIAPNGDRKQGVSNLIVK